MTIINQDRDNTHEYDRQTLYTAPVFGPRGNLWGFNLFIGNELLGTFDTLDEAMREMTAISAQDTPEHYVGGYADYDGTEDFDSLCAYIDGMGDDEYNAHCDS